MNWRSSSSYFLLYSLLTHFSITLSQRLHYRCGSGRSRHKPQPYPSVVYEKEGSNMVLKVTDRGNSSVEWMAAKGTASISQKNFSQHLRGEGADNVYGRLTVRSVDMSMNGTIYKYALKSSDGRTVYESAWLTLVIADVPTVGFQRLSQSYIKVKEKENQEICVNVTGIPEPRITIYRQEASHEALLHSSRFKPSVDNGCFRLSNLVQEDSGQYIILAENCMGKSTVSFTIEVGSTPCYQLVYLPEDVTKEVIAWDDQIKSHHCRENRVGAKSTTVYVLEGHRVTMKADAKHNGRSDTVIRWIGRKGLSKVTQKELMQQLVSDRVDFADETGHITLKKVDQKLNGTQYRYVEYQNNDIVSHSAWATLIIGSVPEVSLSSHHLRKRLNVTNGAPLPEICLTISGSPYPNISLYQFTASKLKIQPVERKRYNLSGNCLRVGPVTDSDSGKLAIVASNCFGSSALVLELTILLPYPCRDKSSITISSSATEVPQPGTSQKDAVQNSVTFAPTVVWKIQGPITDDFSQSSDSQVNQPVTTSEMTSHAVSSGGIFSPTGVQRTREPSQTAIPLGVAGPLTRKPSRPVSTDREPSLSLNDRNGASTSRDDINQRTNNATVRVEEPDIADTIDHANSWNLNTDTDRGLLLTDLPTLEPPDFQDINSDSSGFLETPDVTMPPGNSVNNEQQYHNSGHVKAFPVWAYVVIGVIILVLAVALAMTGITINRRVLEAQIPPPPIAKEIPSPDPTIDLEEKKPEQLEQ